MSNIWYQDLTAFFSISTMLQIYPKDDMSYAEKLNALFRLSIYVTLVMFALTNDKNTFLFAISIGFITYILYYIDETRDETEGYGGIDDSSASSSQTGDGAEKRKRRCTFPTKENPFMNVLMNEYEDDPERRQACAMNDKVNKYVDKYFNENLYRSVDDIYHKNSSDRQFYTMPSTVIPNGQDDFARWLYGIKDKTCKEGNGLKCKYFS